MTGVQTCALPIWFDANPGDVDWFDDAGWKEIADHFGISGWIAKQGGLKGIVFDAEPYAKPFAIFDYKAALNRTKYTFAQYQEKARQRGRETMKAFSLEYPDATILTFFLLSYLTKNDSWLGAVSPVDHPDALLMHNYNLLPAFLDGWLDAAPPTMTIVDGDENGYFYRTPEEFFVSATKTKSSALSLISPENHTRYRTQVEVGFGVYLDAHAAVLKSRYYIPGADAEMLTKNVASALSATDRYVWIYGEEGQFWPDAKELSEWKAKAVSPPGIRFCREPLRRLGTPEIRKGQNF